MISALGLRIIQEESAGRTIKIYHIFRSIFFFFITPRGWPMWWRPWSKNFLIFFRKFVNISWILDAERKVQILELDPICRRG
jgi:hypothetical protein